MPPGTMTSDARVARSAVSYVLLFLLIFGLAGTVDHAEFWKQFKEKRALALGFFGQFVMLPFLGFCAVKAFDLASLTSGPGDANRGIEAVILLLTTSSPGGSYSNWWCFLFNADLALSVAMTTVSSVASVVMLPLNLAIYLNATGSTNIDIEYGPLSVAVAIVVCGIGAGLLASSKLPSRRHVFHTLANVAGLSLIVLGLASTSGSRDGLFAQPWNFFVGCAAPCVFGIVLATASARTAGLTKPQVVSVGIETVYQNTALALSVALASPAPARAAAVPVFYQATQVATLFVYSVCAWKLGWTFAPADVSAYRMLATNYQPVFQKNSALVAEELAAARRELRDAELEAEALGLRSHRGNAAVRSLKKMIASPVTSRGNSVKGGSKTGAGLGVLNLGALFRGGSAELSGEKKKQPRASEAPGNMGGQGPLGAGSAPGEVWGVDAFTPKHRRTKSTPGGLGLGLGLGDIEREAAEAVGMGRDGAAFSFAKSPDPAAPGGGDGDFLTPLKTRVRALEELNIRVARQSTRKATYRDFANVLQGTANSAGSALAAGARAAAAAAVRMSRVGSFISNAGSSPGGSRAGSVFGGSEPTSPVGDPGACAKPNGGKRNRVAPAPEGEPREGNT